nr:hypothetical protein [Bacteroidota bacterium]
MKSKTLITLVVIALISISKISGQELLDFGKFETKVLVVKKVESFTGENGEIIKASKRNNKLLEIELEIISNDRGEFGLYPKGFSCTYYYRDVLQIVPAVAIGTKVNISGTVNEYWYTDPDVSVIIGVGQNEKFKRYVIIEIPKETEKFYLQGPKVIAEVLSN